jgi:hypothetical protein
MGTPNYRKEPDVKFKVVLVHEDNVIGIVEQEYSSGCKVVWLLDGIRTEAYLEHEEYTPITNLREDFNE